MKLAWDLIDECLTEEEGRQTGDVLTFVCLWGERQIREALEFGVWEARNVCSINKELRDRKSVV